MDIEEYISSGIIESYVFGQLTDTERRQVEAMAANHPEIKAEIEAVEDALNNYAITISKTPPPHLKEQIFSKLDIQEKQEKPSPKIVPIAESKQNNYQSWLVAASITLLIGSGIFNFILFKKLTSVQEELSALNTEKDYLAQQFQVQKTNFEQSSRQIAMMVKAGNKMVHLKGMTLAPAATAIVIWDPETKEVYFKADALPMPDSEKQYQLWAIVDGKPVDAGVFDMADSTSFSVQRMKLITGAQAFAVTLEKKGGSINPTMEAMYLIGNI